MARAASASPEAFLLSLSIIPGHPPQSQREAQALQRQLADTWLGLLAERAAGDAQEAASPGVPPDTCLALDVARLEGCALVCLASHDEGVRREALQVGVMPGRAWMGSGGREGVRAGRAGGVEESLVASVVTL